MSVPRISGRLWSVAPGWGSLGKIARECLPWLIFAAVVSGVLCGWRFRQPVEPALTHGPKWIEILNSESRRGKDMPVLVIFRDPADAGRLQVNGKLETTDAGIGKILIPDELVLKTICNSGDRPAFLEGTVDHLHRTEPPGAAGSAESVELEPASLEISGKLVACRRGRPHVLAEGLHLHVRIVAGAPALRQPGIAKWVSSPAIAVMDTAGDVFRKVLLMIFLPLLALTFLRVPLEGKTLSNIRQLGTRLLLANLTVAVFGLAIGAAAAGGMRRYHLGAEQIKAQLGAADGQAAETTYEAHPAISAVARLIPSNPLGSLGDASGSNAMQVLLLAGAIGLLLSFATDEIKTKAAAFLKQGASFLVPDQVYRSKSLMELVQPLIPAGVFCLTASMACTMPRSDGGSSVIAGLLIATLLSQVAVALSILTAAAYWHPAGFRGLKELLRLSWPGIATAGATMSSYAALPELFTLPFIKNSHERRSFLNLGIALNKMGATAYLAAAAAFIALLTNHACSVGLVVSILLFSVLTPIFAAGVPFAAVFALGLVLQFTANLPGPAWWVMAIEPLLDPVVTMINVIANLVAGACLVQDRPEPVPCVKTGVAV